MHRLGLALSGGGFRATLYHLGVVRFLRDAKILPRVTHITSVSGGSVLGAHLALNWDRYCGSSEDFDDAAGEIIRFVKMDVRNRIVRRFPLTSSMNTLRRLLRLRSSRQLTRSGLLEQHYERFLYGDVPLSQLPSRPRLHILATNLSEGCLCSFNHGGLLLQRRAPGRRDRFERVHLGFATVAMAVASSSAFPGFFPPLELHAWDVGADEEQFSCQAFTDGGVYDNLGLRMFRCIEQSWIGDATPLHKDDFLELEDATAALLSATSLPEKTPLRTLRELLAAHDPERLGISLSQPNVNTTDAVVEGLWDIIRSEDLFRDPSFENTELSDPTAQSLFNYVVQSGRKPNLDDRWWLNRHIIESALRQVTGKPCLRAGRKGFDGILVSDAGGKFKVASDGRASGLIRTALRSSDILMDRVWKLELEAFENTPGVLFIPMSEIVDSAQDRHAPHPEIQRQVVKLRTDMDRFSELEISALIQQGYCVARAMCRSDAEYFQAQISSGAPWDPFAKKTPKTTSALSKAKSTIDDTKGLSTARQLRHSARRRIWSTIFSLRDWTTYVWVPLAVFLILSVPYYVIKMNKRAHDHQLVLNAVAETSPVYRRILDLMEHGPARSFEGMPFTDVKSMETPTFTGFEILSDSRIFDLRGWADDDADTPAGVYTRIRVRRTEESGDDTQLRMQSTRAIERMSLTCQPEILNPTLSRMPLTDGRYQWELALDLGRVPIDGNEVVIMKSALSLEMANEFANQGRFSFSIPIETGLVEIWVLMPEGRAYHSFEVSGYPFAKPHLAKIVVPHSKVQMPFGSIATFQLINPKSGFRYECTWEWTNKESQGF